MLAAVAALVLAAAWPAADGAALARDAAAAYADDTRGVHVFEVATSIEIRGPLYRRNDDARVLYVERDGRFAQKRVLVHREGGKTSAPADLERLSSAADGPLARFGVRLPYNAPAEYAYDAPRIDGSHATVPFRALVRDGSHGDGTMTVDLAAHRIVSLTLAPAQLPPHAATARVDLVFGPTGDGRWDITRAVHAFTGSYGILRGGAVATSTYGGYRTFATVAAAVAALNE